MKDCCLGTQMPYNYIPEVKAPPPEGYAPFYINYLGRHGGRYLDSPEGVEWLVAILQCAHEHQGLTLRGLELLSKLLNVMELNQDCYGNLSTEGARMLEGIAQRMYLNYPQVFGKKVDAVATYRERAIQSRDVFLNELERVMSADNIHIHTNGQIDPQLRFFDLNQEYLNYKETGTWKHEVVNFEARYNDSVKILERIFNRQFFCHDCLNQNEKNRFATELFQIYTNQFDVNGVISLGYYFTSQEKYRYWESNNLKQYLLMGPGPVGQCITTHIAFGLLMDFLHTSEEAILSREKSADLRFAHAETISPFAALLRLPCMCEQTSSPYKVAFLWKNCQVAPMAANMQWIFYDQKRRIMKREQDVLVQLKYNERTIAFPIPTSQYPYYRWIDVKDYYQSVLDGMHLPQGETLIEQVKYYQPLC